MNPIWRWTPWTTSLRPWPVTSVSRRSFTPRLWREGVSCSTERICWSRTPGIPSIAVNLPLILPFFLSSSGFYGLSFSCDWLTVWLSVSLAVSSTVLFRLSFLLACCFTFDVFPWFWHCPDHLPAFFILYLFKAEYIFVYLILNILLSSYDRPLPTGKRSSGLSLLSNLRSQRFPHRQIPGPAVCKSPSLFFGEIDAYKRHFMCFCVYVCERVLNKSRSIG